MQEYISIEPLPLCSAINEVKHVLCIGYSIYICYACRSLRRQFNSTGRRSFARHRSIVKLYTLHCRTYRMVSAVK